LTIWKDIIGYEGYYQISSSGDIKSIKYRRESELGMDLKPYKDWRGYLVIKLHKDGHRKTFKVHRLVALHFLGSCPEGYQINHKDTIKLNNHFLNLEYVTPRDNIRHAILNGLRPQNKKCRKTWKVLYA
jgi:hypothetical protein